MATRANPEAPASRTNKPDGPARPRPVRLRDGGAVTGSIAELIAERKAIWRRVPSGTGLSGVDDDRIRAIDVAIDRLWADLRRQRLPPPQAPVRPAARR